MVKFLLLGIWVSAVLSGSVYYFTQQNMDLPTESKKGYFGGLDYIKLEPVTVAIIDENQIKGYIIFEAVYTIQQGDENRLSVPIDYLFRDLIIGSIHGNPDIDIYRMEKFDLKAFQKHVLQSIANKTVIFQLGCLAINLA